MKRLSLNPKLKLLRILFGVIALFLVQSSYGAGVTIVTHGFQFGAIDHGHGWVEAMGDYIADRAGGTKYIYRVEITGGYPMTTTNPHGLGLGSFTCQYSGLPPIEQSANAEIVIKLYWDSVANSINPLGVTPTTQEIAEATLIALTNVPFAPFLTKQLAETPIHLIGHSRGGSVVAEISRLLGEQGIWVHQMTTLDPHPTKTPDGPNNDAEINVYENVLFADNYYQDIFGTFPQGESVANANNRHLTRLDGGYPDDNPILVYDGNHSDVHLWYHGTVNTDQNASDGEQIIADTMRDTWYSSYEDRGTGAGFYYSRLGGGGWKLNVQDGYYNNGDFNNSPANRTNLTRNANEWPSLIKIDPDFGISVQAGNAFPLHYVFQSFDSISSVLIYLDPDQNPYNGNGINLALTPTPNQSPTQRGTRTIDVNGAVPLSTSPGFYYLYGKITNPNGTRYLYALGKVRVTSAGVITVPSAPTSLSAVPVSSSQINLTWADVADETGFKIERRLGYSGGWSQITTLSANVTSFSDTGRAAGTAYSYQVRAYNSAGNSAYTTIASATTQPSAGTTYTLNIASSNPSSGVKVSSFVGTGQFAFGTTLTSRPFANGSEVGVTCPSTLVGGLVFQKWQLDGNDYASSTVTPTYTTVTMNSAHTLTAFFGATPPPVKVLSSLAIEGSSSVDEQTSAQYLAHAYYTDSSSAYVNAQWADNSSYASISSAGLLDASAVTSDQNIQVQATFTAGGVTKTATQGVTIRNTDTVPTYSLTLAASHGYISVQPQMSSYPAGTEVRLIANADDDYVFDHWSGNASGTDRTVYITMNGNESVTANFTADTSYGRLQVNLSPTQAVNEGTGWRYDNFTDWQASGNIVDGITPRSNRYVQFKDIPGWITPGDFQASVVGGQTTVTNATYREIPGTVQVTIQPAAAVAAGAHWRLGGGAWQASAASIGDVIPGAHQVEFQIVPGWTTPATQPVAVQRAGNVITFGQYNPPLGLSLITSVSPKTGPIAGGTLLTIEGVNFSMNAAVSIGGRTASNVTFVSATRVTAVTPPSPVFGSAEIVVNTGASSATNANAFAYGIPRGTNMTLITSSGGMYQAVACNNQYLFIGQGTTFLVYDIANPANPVFVSSVTVPGLIQDIALSGNYVVVAANDAGVHIVDISNPAAPRLRGFYNASGVAYGVKVLAGRAYVANESGGLLILDVTNPDAPTRLSSLDLGAFAFDVALKNSVAGLFAIVSAQDRMFIVDVSNPQSPSKLSEVAAAGANFSVALAGNLAFLGRAANGVDTVDISNLSNPVSRGRILDSDIYVAVAATGNTVVLAGGGQEAFQLVDVSGVSTTARGHLDISVFSMELYGAYRIAIQNGVVWVAGGTAVFGVNIANLDAPQRIFRKDDQGGRFEKVAISGSAVAAAPPGRLFGYNYSGNTLTPTASLSAQGGNSQSLFFYGNILFDVDGLFERFQLQSDGNLTPLASLTISNVWLAAAYLTGSKLLSVSAAKSDNHAVISEHDPSRTDAGWILRQKNLPFITSGGAVQIVGAQEFFFLAYIDISVSSGKWNLASYIWSASAPTWQISGLDIIRALQLSDNNRFLHVGEGRNYRIFDVADTSNPVSLSTNATTYPISDILISGDYAYLACFGEVLVYDIADKSRPKLIRSYNTPGDAHSLAKIGDRLIVADYNAGIQVLGLPDIAAPQVFITAPVALPQFQTTNSAITLGGAAEDDSGQISRVIWSNDRGGGGVAEGTTDWLVSVVSLQPGTNVLIVTAFDAEGNSGTDQITIISTPPDTTVPVITITGPKPDDEFVVGTNVLTLSGSAADNQSVTNLTWSNDRGGSGAMNLAGQNWSVTNLLLALGPNLVQVTATDSSGNIASDTAVIFFVPPDTNAPAVLIDFPTLNAVYETGFSVLNLSGTAADNLGVTEIKWTSNHGGQGVANGVAPWSVNDIPLQPGLNVIEVTAYDAAGNTATDALSVIYTLPPLHLNALGMSNGVFLLEMSGPPITCVIQVSSNLVQWLPLSTNTIPVEGSMIISDPDASNQPVRFYRAVSFATGTSDLPTLSATLLDSELLLSWPTNFTGFTLETATNLPPTSWTSNSILPAIVNGQYTVTNAITGGAKFYRLKK